MENAKTHCLMMGYTPPPAAIEIEPSVQERYQLKLSKKEVQFLGNFNMAVLSLTMGNTLILERAVIASMHRRYHDRWLNPKSCTLNLTAAEAIAMRRLLEKAPVHMAPMDSIDRHSVFGKLSQKLLFIQ